MSDRYDSPEFGRTLREFRRGAIAGGVGVLVLVLLAIMLVILRATT